MRQIPSLLSPEWDKAEAIQVFWDKSGKEGAMPLTRQHIQGERSMPQNHLTRALQYAESRAAVTHRL